MDEFQLDENRVESGMISGPIDDKIDYDESDKPELWRGFIENTLKDRLFVRATQLCQIHDEESFGSHILYDLFKESFFHYDNVLSITSHHVSKVLWEFLMKKQAQNRLFIVKFEAEKSSNKSSISLIKDLYFPDSSLYSRFYDSIYDENENGYQFVNIAVPLNSSKFIEGFYLVPIREKDKLKYDKGLLKKFNICLRRDSNLLLGFIFGHQSYYAD